MKFVLQKVAKVQIVPGRTEDEYHYQSEDGVHQCSFHGGKRAWTFVVSGGNLPLIKADELVNEWCVQGMQADKPVFEDRVRELNINL
jgi:hypothetical protein